MRRLLCQCRLSLLQVGHPLGLGAAEPIDLAVLRLLRPQVGECEADEVVAVHHHRRAPDVDGDGGAVADEQVELGGDAETVRSNDLVQADREASRRAASGYSIEASFEKLMRVYRELVPS